MKLQFKVDQATCFRHGVDAPNSVVTLDVKPDALTQEQRDAVANNLFNGAEVHGHLDDELIIAAEPTVASLLRSIAEMPIKRQEWYGKTKAEYESQHLGLGLMSLEASQLAWLERQSVKTEAQGSER
jgi:hypothetical protein